jgi:very-short-patch-repair endonuclease
MQEDRLDPIEFARRLRRCQQPGEDLLWQLLRDRRCVNAKFRRQHPVPPYNCDFFCFELSLDIECDGKDHFTEDGLRKDAQRTKFLNDLGIAVLRFTNHQIENETQAVLSEIRNTIDRLRNGKWNGAVASDSEPSPPAPLPKGEGGK